MTGITRAASASEQLDGAMQIMDKYGKTGNDNEQYVSYETLARFLVAHVNDNIAFKIDLFRRIVYAWLLGNNDMHLRNFGLVYSDGLTPALARCMTLFLSLPIRNIFTQTIWRCRY